MDLLRQNLLTILLLLPTAGALLTADDADGKVGARAMALAASLVTFAASLLLLVAFDWHHGTSYDYESSGGTMQMVQAADWIPALHVQYKVGLDGLSFPLVILTTGDHRAGVHCLVESRRR